MDRYQLLIVLGNEQEPLDEKYKTEQNLIEGCQSCQAIDKQMIVSDLTAYFVNKVTSVSGVVSLFPYLLVDTFDVNQRITRRSRC